MRDPVQLSIIVPVHNEEDSLPQLHAELSAALAGGRQYELIFVDDGSRDRSLTVLRKLWRADPHVRIVKFTANYGQTAALAAGFHVSEGDVVVTLDGDLQNDPADIPALVDRLEEGYDIVAGWRKHRHDGFVLRLLPSFVANRLISLVTGVRIHDTGCTLKAFRRELVKNLPIYAEQHRFLPVMSAGSGARITESVVNHRPRLYGHSKYGLGRATRVFLDLISIKLIAQFSQRPLHYFGMLSLGFLALAVGFLSLGLLVLPATAHSGPLVFIGRWQFVIFSIGLLLFVLILYFAFLGLLGELAVKASGMHRRGVLDRILNELH